MNCSSPSQGDPLPPGRVDGARAVGLFNTGNDPMKVAANFSELKLDGKQTVRDLWRQKDLGSFDDKFETEIPPHGVVLVKLTPAK